MGYRIPLFQLNYGEAEQIAVQRALESGWISMGPRTQELEQLFAEKFGALHATAVSSCTAALHLALRILGIRAGDEVIVPSLTFVATVNAVRYVDATPVFCDITGSHDLTIDAGEIEKRISPRTKAIIIMHYGGFPCDMGAIMEIARRHHLPVIEDAAHAPLSRYQGKILGTIGDIGCFSFFSNKNVSTAEGGMIVTQSEEHHRAAVLLRSHGMTSLSYERSKGHATTYDVIGLGYNYRMDDIRSALGIVQLNKLGDDQTRRAVIRGWYLERLRGLDLVTIPFAEVAEVVSNYIFPVLLSPRAKVSRDEVRARLSEAGIETSVHYPAVHRFSIYQEFAARLPRTEHASDHLISLPMHAHLERNHVDEVASRLTDALCRA
jgi:dTDP-4-amino-4,6-dideoxygalactose transaminase